jgi:anti-sigma factor RsiW
MNCKEVVELSSPYLSRELAADCMAEIRKHLESCPACAGELDQLSEIDARVRDSLLAEPINTTVVDRRVRKNIAPPSRRWISVAASIAAAVVIAVTAYQVSSGSDRTCAAAASDHRVEVVDGERRTWLVDASAIGQLAEKQGIDSSAVRRLASEGFQLERGKLCRLNGRIFLHLVYSSGGGAVSVFLRPHDAAWAAGIRHAESGAEHVAYFDTAHVSAIVVTGQSSESATKLARFAQRVL